MIKGQKFLKFRCTGCGNCCKDVIVPVTSEDVQRIKRGTGQASEEIVEYYDSSEIDTGSRDPGWIKMRAGRRILGLKKKRGACQYLKDDRCTIYEHRPVTCRRYPFNLALDEHGRLKKLSIHDAVKCLYELNGKQTHRELKATSEWEDREDGLYHTLVKAWNRNHPTGTKKEFLRYLGLIKK